MPVNLGTTGQPDFDQPRRSRHRQLAGHGPVLLPDRCRSSPDRQYEPPSRLSLTTLACRISHRLSYMRHLVQRFKRSIRSRRRGFWTFWTSEPARPCHHDALRKNRHAQNKLCLPPRCVPVPPDRVFDRKYLIVWLIACFGCAVCRTTVLVDAVIPEALCVSRRLC